VLQVDWHGARAYLAWLAERTGKPWRLPGEQEWEKAARGVDGRWYPWGNELDPSWCCMTDSHDKTRLPAVVDSYPVDVSPYGVRGMGGNAEDWCLDLFDIETSLNDGDVVSPDPAPQASPRALRAARGGAWSSTSRGVRSADRGRDEPTNRDSSFSFRGLFRPER